MEISNDAVIISSAVVISGWIVNNILKRRDEIASKRLDLRLKTLHSLVPLSSILINLKVPFPDTIDVKLLERLENAHLDIQTYGYADEMELFNKCVNAINKNDVEKLDIYSTQLFLLVVPRIRRELNLPKIKTT